jgi:uncharacterized protein YgiB involved in biofilm formation
MARRASAHVTLVLIGAAALTACGAEPETPRARDTYLTLDDCAADWGRPDYCERQQVTTGAGSSTYFHGPTYFMPYRDVAQAEARDQAQRAGAAALREGPSNRSVGRTAVAPSSAGSTARGGFGSSARGFSSGG